ncbi:MAG: DNA-methyltransferase [Cognatishimia activa]
MSFERDITIGNCRLILGDMRDVLPKLKSRPKLCLSDPPYRLTSGGQSHALGGILSGDAYDNSGELFDMVEWAEMAPLIYDVLDDDADAIIMSSDRELSLAAQCFAHHEFSFHRILVWDKITATPNRWYMPNLEFALYLFKGRARKINDCSSKALIRCPQKDVSQLYLPKQYLGQGRKAHPTEKPVALMETWACNSTDPGDLIIDPFMGAGSTIVAAALNGRPAIGIEKDPKWFEVAVARVTEAVNSPQSQLPLSAPVKAYQEALAL